MAVILRRAVVADAPIITATRRTVWNETYRGIYPDAMIDEYDYDYHLSRDTRLISSPDQHYYLYMDGEKCVGYLSFGPCNYGQYKDFYLCLNSLYICKGYKGQGLGKQAFSLLKNYARELHIQKFFCGCNIHNLPAQGFYHHMGGIVGNVSGGHENKAEDIIHFEFYM